MVNPQNILDAQYSVLGAILLDDKLMGQAFLQLRADDFTSAPCRIVWEAMCSLYREGMTIDPVTVRAKLQGFDKATDFLVQLMEITPTASGAARYFPIVREQGSLSRLRDIGQQITEAETMADMVKLVAQANALTIVNRARSRRTMMGMLNSFGSRHASGKAPDYLPWPLKKLTQRVKIGLGKFIVIGGYPSDGKTAFALACALSQSSRYRVAFYSFETDPDTVEDRVLSAAAGINMEHIQDNALNDNDWTAYGMAASRLTDYDFDVIAAAGMTVEDIRADALANRYDIIYIDYIQLITPSYQRGSSRYDAVTQISLELHRLSQSAGIAVIGLAQLSRPDPDRKGKIPPPSMHSIRESGQVEQDADVIMLLYRIDPNAELRRLHVCKNKEGRTGRFDMEFDGAYQRFWLVSQLKNGAAVRTGDVAPALPEPPQQSFELITEQDPNLPFR